MSAQQYIDQSAARVGERFTETRRLQALWTDAVRLALRQPTADSKTLVAEAHAAYQAEQERALSQSATTHPA